MIIFSIADGNTLLSISNDEAHQIASGLDMTIGYEASELDDEELANRRKLFNQFKELAERV